MDNNNAAPGNGGGFRRSSNRSGNVSASPTTPVASDLVQAILAMDNPQPCVLARRVGWLHLSQISMEAIKESPLMGRYMMLEDQISKLKTENQRLGFRSGHGPQKEIC